MPIFVEDYAPVTGATPLGAGRFHLSFQTHTGRWEPPVVADLRQLVHEPVALLGLRTSGTDRGHNLSPYLPLSGVRHQPHWAQAGASLSCASLAPRGFAYKGPHHLKITGALREVVWVNSGTCGYAGTVREPAACT